MRLAYSKRILLLSTLIFIGILVLDIIFTGLLLDKIIGINDKVRQLTISAEEREKELNLKDSIMSSVGEREKFEQYFVAAGEGKTAEFITYLESLAKENGVALSIKFVGYEPVTDLGASEVISFLRFRVAVTGNWNNTYRFLQTIENLPKVVSVNAVALNANSEIGSGKASTKNWSADLDFSVVKLKN